MREMQIKECELVNAVRELALMEAETEVKSNITLDTAKIIAEKILLLIEHSQMLNFTDNEGKGALVSVTAEDYQTHFQFRSREWAASRPESKKDDKTIIEPSTFQAKVLPGTFLAKYSKAITQKATTIGEKDD